MTRTSPTIAPLRTPAARPGFSLLELTVVTAILAAIVLAMGSVLALATHDLQDGQSKARAARRRADAMDELSRDLQFLTAITERSDRAIAFTVPDRDGDTEPETIRYAWESDTGDPGVAGDPLFRRVNGGPAVPVIDALDDFALAYETRTVRGDWIPVEDETYKLLLVVDDPAALTASEVARRDLLESWGYEVTLFDDDAPAEQYAATIEGYRVAYVTDGVKGSSLGAKLTDASIGVVNEHPDVTEHLEVEEKKARDYGDDAVVILDDAHYITSVFTTGPLVLATGSIRLLRSDRGLAPGAVALAAKTDNPSQFTLVTVEEGEMLDHGLPAPGRRVALPWGVDLDFSTLNMAAQLLMRRSVDWAADNESLGEGVLGYATAFDVPVDGVRRMQVATQATLSEDGVVTVIGAFIGGEADDCRFAIYSDTGGEPDALLVESESFGADADFDWRTAPVPPTALTAGTYWIALAFASSSQRCFLEAGGELRYRDHWAEKSGYLSSWGVSDDSFNYKMSIYAGYSPE